MYDFQFEADAIRTVPHIDRLIPGSACGAHAGLGRGHRHLTACLYHTLKNSDEEKTDFWFWENSS